MRMRARCRARVWRRSEIRIGTRKSPTVRPRSWAGRRSIRGMPIVIPDLLRGTGDLRARTGWGPFAGGWSLAEARPGSVEVERLHDRHSGRGPGRVGPGGRGPEPAGAR